jgi:signal transduction histidine kinase/ActR/RegA family two-component response regulator
VKLRPHLLPLLILLVGLLITGLTAWQLERTDVERSQARFNAIVERAKGRVEATYNLQLALLRATAGLFNASGEVTREEFRSFVERLDLPRNYPGVLGIGFAAYAPTRPEIEARIAGAGSPTGFAVRHWPAGERDGYSAILYLEPLNRRNGAALGFDMMSEAVRQEAMVRARRTLQSTMSGRVLLVQEIETAKQPGFLIYTPLRPGGSVAGGSFGGWVYSPLRGPDLFGPLFQGAGYEHVRVAIFDGEPAANRLLFANGRPGAGGGHFTSERLELGGRTLTIQVASGPAFAQTSPVRLWLIVLLAGLAISVLLAALAWQAQRVVGRVQGQVVRRTAQLNRSNERLRQEIAARSQAEEQLFQAQKMEAVGQLTGGIAHDFNNMLAVVIGSLDFARHTDDVARLKRLIEQALKGAGKAAELTQRLLAFSRRQTLIPAVVDANKLVAEMSELLRRTIGRAIRLETVLAGGLWRVFADPAQLESAILNLAVNARDAMPDDGKLTIETANCHLDERYAAANPDVAPGQYVLIAVSDTGEGMPPEVQARVLEPFFTTKAVGRGTGLGLPQVFGFVKQSGGHLKISSEVGRGTTIRIYLPRHQGADTMGEGATRAQLEQLPRGRPEELILAVEDEEDVRLMSVGALRDLGYTVIHAADGAAALRCLEEHPGVRLIFTDVVMPEMDGVELAAAVRDRYPETRLLFTTGYARNAMNGEGRLRGTVDLISKPFTIAQLAGKVRQVLDRPADESA